MKKLLQKFTRWVTKVFTGAAEDAIIKEAADEKKRRKDASR